MSKLDTIRQLVREALSLPTETGVGGNYLWDSTERIVRNAEYISRMPELAEAEVQIDRFCLTTAAYFCLAGLSRQSQGQNSASESANGRANGVEPLDLAIEAVNGKLADILEKPRVEKVTKIIAQSSDRFTNMTEAMILADARSLDDMGAAGIFNEFRRYCISGKGVADALSIWKMKTDYGYWQARLKESFRFDSVRKLAEQRLAVTEYFMDQLKLETEAGDLEKLTAAPAGVQK